MEIKKIFEAKDLEDLKKLGKMLEIKYALQEVLGDRVKIRSRSWEELFVAIKKLSALSFDMTVNNSKENVLIVTNKESDINIPYFKTETDKIIYALLELQGKQRQEKLNITNFCYNNPQYAKKWRNDLVKIIHPDKTSHPKAAEAMNVLQELYEGMIE